MANDNTVEIGVQVNTGDSKAKLDQIAGSVKDLGTASNAATAPTQSLVNAVEETAGVADQSAASTKRMTEAVEQTAEASDGAAQSTERMAGASLGAKAATQGLSTAVREVGNHLGGTAEKAADAAANFLSTDKAAKGLEQAVKGSGASLGALAVQAVGVTAAIVAVVATMRELATANSQNQQSLGGVADKFRAFSDAVKSVPANALEDLRKGLATDAAGIQVTLSRMIDRGVALVNMLSSLKNGDIDGAKKALQDYGATWKGFADEIEHAMGVESRRREENRRTQDEERKHANELKLRQMEEAAGTRELAEIKRDDDIFRADLAGAQRAREEKRRDEIGAAYDEELARTEKFHQEKKRLAELDLGLSEKQLAALQAIIDDNGKFSESTAKLVGGIAELSAARHVDIEKLKDYDAKLGETLAANKSYTDGMREQIDAVREATRVVIEAAEARKNAEKSAGDDIEAAVQRAIEARKKGDNDAANAAAKEIERLKMVRAQKLADVEWEVTVARGQIASAHVKIQESAESTASAAEGMHFRGKSAADLHATSVNALASAYNAAAVAVGNYGRAVNALPEVGGGADAVVPETGTSRPGITVGSTPANGTTLGGGFGR